MPSSPRLRQVVVAARELPPVAMQIQAFLGLADPYHDPGVAEFGLENAVFAVGDTFFEIVSPTQPDTAAGRYLERRGGDAGYMAIFQVTDVDEARKRVANLGVRVVWQVDLPDISGTHLHPRDVPGAIVSIDSAQPRQSWRWAGPQWTGGAPTTDGTAIREITVAAVEPAAAAAKWATVLDVRSSPDGLTLALDDDRQAVHFVAADSLAREGISTIVVDAPGRAADQFQIAGVRIEIA